MTISDFFLDLLFPIRCIRCGIFGKTYLCAKCLNSIPIRTSFECVGCKHQAYRGMTCVLCRPDYALDHLLVAVDYRNPDMKRAIHTFKYRFIRELSAPLAILMQKYVRSLAQKKHWSIFEDTPLIIPVPLTQRRLNWRGFNQAELLASHIANAFQMSAAYDVLQRTVQRKPQAELANREERIQNARDLFLCSSTASVHGRTVLLIDDVCTTGATLNACAQTLKASGAKKVMALVLARG